MADSSELRARILDLPPKRLALLALQLQEELERERDARTEPVAVVGMACRFPGDADSPDAYWELLREGRDVIREVPADRWSADELYDPDPDAPGRIATRWGGYLTDVQGFDAGFFSVSPREARAMDPQQRLLLEVTWRAFEDAGIPPSDHYGTSAGVFIGLCNNDYLTRLLKEGPDAIDAYLSSGNAYSVAAGRISFTFGFQGPAVTVDTACSSSLVALHDACRSLRDGESDLAVAGGVNVMSSPETAMALSRARMMAPDGRCKTFDDAADGFVRAEGCGVLILKRLSDARRDGDAIHAVLKGTAVGQDGRSTGLTVPNGPAQEQVVRDALRRSGLQPSDIGYIEAHGTGTSLGDPIEIRALGRVFGPDRERPLVVGSVKTNMGHLESAAGVAGVIKAVLAVREGFIPPHLHFHTPSRHIEWDEFPIEVPARGRAWPEGGVRRAGVSSFGFSGTNAHVVVEEAPTDGGATGNAPRRASATTVSPGPASPTDGGGEARPSPVELLTISAASPEALEELTTAYRGALGTLSGASFRDFCHTTRVGRTAFPFRRAVVGEHAAEMEAGFAMREGAPVVREGRGKVTEPPQIAFVFTGQGAQHPGMGRGLYEHDRWFRRAIDECAEILDPTLPMPLRRILFDGEGDGAPIYSTTLAQPAVVAYEWSLTRMWDARGVRPSAVLGHSLGEFVAACVAGVFSLEDMLRLVAERGRLLDSLPRGDRMAAVFAPAEVLERMIPQDGSAVVGAYNAPGSTVVSGTAGAVDAVVEACRGRGIDSRELRLDRGFHSPRVEPILDDLQQVADGIEHRAPSLPLPWNVSGAIAMAAPPAGYWRDHARQPVRFMQGVRALADLGIRHFVEIGPHPALSPLVGQTLEAEDPVLVPSQRRDGDSVRDAADATGHLWVEGVEVDLRAFEEGHRRVRGVPGHPLVRTPYWVDPPATPRPAAPRGSIPGVRLSTPVPIHETVFTPESPSFLAQHRFQGEAIVPGPVFAEAAREAARATGRPARAVGELELLTPAVVGDAGLRVQTILEEEGRRTTFRVVSRPAETDESAEWTEHARGLLLPAPDGPPPAVEGAEQGASAVDGAAHLERLRAVGFELGPAAARWTELRVGPGGASARLLPPDEPRPAALARALHLDAGAQVLGAALAGSDPMESRMLAGVDEIAWVDEAGPPVRCVAVPRSGQGADAGGDVVLYDAEGRAAAWLRGVRLAAAPAPRTDPRRWYHRLEWRSAPLAPEAASTDRLGADALARVAKGVAAGWPDRVRSAGLRGYVDRLPELRARAGGFAAAALAELGLEVEPGEPLPDDLAHRLGVVPTHRRLLTRILEILTEEGFVTRDGSGRHRVARSFGPPPSRPDDALEDPAPGDPVGGLLERCGRELAGVLSGAVDPLELLFPDGSWETTRSIYRDTAFGRAFNDGIADAVRALGTGNEPPPLRVLEVGAGSGTTTRAVLDALEGRPVRYTVTDVSPTLVHQAEKAFEGTEGVEFRTLDLEVDPGDQGFALGGYDVVLAANVVHATARIRPSLEHLRSLLVPGGVLILLEGTRPEPWVDLTFGLTPGWWRFSDHGLRPDYPLLSVAAWTEALEACGFSEIAALPGDAVEDNTLAREAGQVVLAARTSADADPAAEDRPASAAFVDGRGRTPMEVVDALRTALATPGDARIRLVTEAAQSIGLEDIPDPRQAMLWGLGRVFALEHPDRWAGLLDVARGTSDEVVRARVRQEDRTDGQEDQVAWRGSERHVARLVSASPPSSDGAPIRPGTWVVTGGLGGLGLKVGGWLAAEGATRLVLLGRTADPDAWAEEDPRRGALEALREEADVVVRSVDVADAEAVAACFDELRAAGPPLRGVVHAAAAFGSAALVDLRPEELDAVLAAKVRGTDHLAAATAADDLDALVLFSSTTSILGVAGLGAYAAANQYLDAFAVRARAQGHPVVSIGWGIWDEMRLASEEERERYVRAGLRPMASADALDAMGRILAGGVTHAVVADVDWARLRGVYEGRRRRPILSELGTPAEEGAAESGSGQGLKAIAELPTEERREALVSAVEREVRQVLRIAPTRTVDPDEGFFAMGMDSLMSVELKSRLERRLDTRLPSTLTFNYPSIEAVAGFVEGRLDSLHATGPDPSPPTGGDVASSAPGAGGAAAAAPVDDLTEDELARELERRLSRLEGKDS